MTKATHRPPLLLEPEPGAPAVIEPGWAPAPLAPAARPRGTLGLVAAGLGVLLASWAGLASIGFVQELFARSPVQGWIGVAGFGSGFALLAYAALREYAGWRRLAGVDGLRARLASPDLATGQHAARGWLAGLELPAGERAALLAAIADAETPDALHALLRARLSAALAESAGRLGRQAALEGAALVAVLPHPALDGLFAGLRGLRVIRQVAALYGLRPGTLASLALARRVAWTAAGTAGADLLAQTAMDQAVSGLPGLRHLASAIPGAGVAAVRLYRLARITAAACDPVGE